MKKIIVCIYILIFAALFTLAVKWRINVVIEKRNAPIVSFVKEWNRVGKPVVVQEVKKQNVPSYTKVTAWQISPNAFEGHVSKAVRDKLRIGQEMIFKVDDSTFKGKISMVSEDISFDTGMYPVHVAFERKYDISGWLVAYARIDTLKNVIRVSNEIVYTLDDEFFVWKIVNGKAVKQQITVQDRSGYSLIVRDGLKEGDFLVVKGYSKLEEGDKVKILATRDGGPTL